MSDISFAPSRDEIAMFAITGVMTGGGVDTRRPEGIVARAYEIADEMIKKRNEYNEQLPVDPENPGDDSEIVEG